jgi:ribosomal-protein-serine acetyltransferase
VADFPLVVRPGLELRVADPAVADEYFALVERNLQRLARWEPWATAPQSLSGVRTYLAWHAQAHRSGAQAALLIWLDDAVVGSCSARIDRVDRVAEVGYWIDAGHEGRGLAAAAVGALTDHLLARGDLARVQARTGADNVRSRALLERLGFEFEGVLRSAQLRGDVRVDLAVYARITG